MTSTYGDGEAPSNATGFAKRFKKQIPEKKIKYAVLGFGSKSYLKFCQFAENIDDLLYNNPRYQQLVPLFKINNQN
ncbi:MAG: flavodoxin domain-containing protein [Flavobacteriaceae bacterium]